MIEVFSPITGEKNVRLVETFPVEKVIEEYKNYAISVSKYFVGVETVFLYECNDTKYRFYYPLTIFGDGEFYDQLQEKNEGYYNKNRWEHDYCANLISANETVLEIGAGSGYFLSRLNKMGVQTTGLEISQKAIETARKRGVVIKEELIGEHVIGNENRYDVVCSFQVLEHIYDVRNYISDCLKVLKKGGKLVIGVPNNNPYIFRYDKWHLLNLPPHHAGLWSKTAFENIPKYFNVSLSKASIEPLREYKEWYLIQKKHYTENNKILGLFMGLVPRPIYKLALKVFSRFIQGRNIVVVFVKN